MASSNNGNSSIIRGSSVTHPINHEILAGYDVQFLVILPGHGKHVCWCIGSKCAWKNKLGLGQHKTFFYHWATKGGHMTYWGFGRFVTYRVRSQDFLLHPLSFHFPLPNTSRPNLAMTLAVPVKTLLYPDANVKPLMPVSAESRLLR